MRPAVLIVLYLAVVLLPLALAWSGNRPPRSFWNELAAGAGLLAFAIILVEFILSGRFRTVSGKIGMDVTMRFHQVLARTALALALVHPFLYRTPFAVPKPWDPTRQLTLTMDFGALTSGMIGWVLLPVFIVLSLGRDRMPYTYETWRLMHGLGAVLVAGFVLDHTLGAGRYSADPALAGLWLALFALAIGSLLFVYIAKPLMQRRRAFAVASVKPIAMYTWELAFEPENHPGLTFQAGQFAWLKIGNNPFQRQENPFSISSAPASGGRLEFVIKELGDFTRTVGDIEPGATAYLDGPYGNLVVTGRAEPGIALIAGGVGIAPLMGILRQLHHDRDPRPTVLVYGNRLEEKIVYRDELDRLSREHGTDVIHVLMEPTPEWTGETGRMDPALIRKTFAAPEMKQWLFVLCGPPAMMVSVEDTLIDLGVSAPQILSESFKYD